MSLDESLLLAINGFASQIELAVGSGHRANRYWLWVSWREALLAASIGLLDFAGARIKDLAARPRPCADLQAVRHTRSLFVKHRTAVINQIRGLLAEYGLVIAPSPEKVRPAVVRF